VRSQSVGEQKAKVNRVSSFGSDSVWIRVVFALFIVTIVFLAQGRSKSNHGIWVSHISGDIDYVVTEFGDSLFPVIENVVVSHPSPNVEMFLSLLDGEQMGRGYNEFSTRCDRFWPEHKSSIFLISKIRESVSCGQFVLLWLKRVMHVSVLRGCITTVAPQYEETNSSKFVSDGVAKLTSHLQATVAQVCPLALATRLICSIGDQTQQKSENDEEPCKYGRPCARRGFRNSHPQFIQFLAYPLFLLAAFSCTLGVIFLAAAGGIGGWRRVLMSVGFLTVGWFLTRVFFDIITHS
jgi:hypothetical protein